MVRALLVEVVWKKPPPSVPEVDPGVNVASSMKLDPAPPDTDAVTRSFPLLSTRSGVVWPFVNVGALER